MRYDREIGQLDLLFDVLGLADHVRGVTGCSVIRPLCLSA